MSSSTIIRAFNKVEPKQMIHEAKQLANSSAYAVKKFFYNLVTLGCGKAIQEARAERREKEVAEVATEVLKGLPVNHSELTNPVNEDKVFYTSMENKYQIILEGEKLCLYTGTVPYSLFGSRNSKFEKDQDSRTVLKTISLQNNLDTLRKNLATVKEYYQLKSNTALLEQEKWTLAGCIAEAKNKKDKINEEKITNKTNLPFHGKGGNFDPAWESHLKNITASNYDIKESIIANELVCEIFNKDAPDQFIHVAAKVTTGTEGTVSITEQIKGQINEYFTQNSGKTLEGFLNQPVAVNDSSKYQHLKNAYKQTMISDDIGHLYLLLELELDKH